MKVLIAHDGTECSDAALEDLKLAGLPENTEARVFCVSEYVPRTAQVPYIALAEGTGGYFEDLLDDDSSCEHCLGVARDCAEQTAQWLGQHFPGWKVSTEAWVDAARPAILREAAGWKPDLIVVGTHGRRGLKLLLPGSVSQYVLHHTQCPVRIGRHRLRGPDQPIRLVIGSDGSADARKAVASVAARIWPAGSEARVVGVLDSAALTALPAAIREDETPIVKRDVRSQISDVMREDVEKLAGAGLLAQFQVRAGEPCESLIAEAEEWGADCIFVGARGRGSLGRMLLGSVSSSVATHAPCSVEVVR